MAERPVPEPTAKPPAVSRTEPRERALSERVIEALAAARGVAPIEMERPLTDSIDPEALDAIFAPRHDGSPRAGDGYVEFSSNGYRIVVRKDGTIHLDPA